MQLSKSKNFHLCRTLVVRVALVSHSSCSCSTRVALKLHLCCSFLIRVALVLHLCSIRVYRFQHSCCKLDHSHKKREQFGNSDRFLLFYGFVLKCKHRPMILHKMFTERLWKVVFTYQVTALKKYMNCWREFSWVIMQILIKNQILLLLQKKFMTKRKFLNVLCAEKNIFLLED